MNQMVVIISSSINTQLRGYITRFLYEVSTGIYIGNLSRRVSDLLWNHITTESELKGNATMIRTTDNEQGYEISMHNNSSKSIISLDGLQIIEKLDTSSNNDSNMTQKNWSKARWRHKH